MDWKRASLCFLSVLVAFMGLGVAACAGELPVPGQMPTTSVGGNTTAPTEDRPVQLGDEVAATWSQAIQELAPLLEGIPPVATLRPTVAALKESYVQKMITLGREIDALGPSDRGITYDRVTSVLDGQAGTDWFQDYVRLYDQYAAADDQASQEFAVLLSTFNTLTQYAFFELLKAQEPDEAARLGID